MVSVVKSVWVILQNLKKREIPEIFVRGKEEGEGGHYIAKKILLCRAQGGKQSSVLN